MKLNDYVALHANEANGDIHMLRPEEQLSGGLDSTALASDSQHYINTNNKFHMTQTTKSYPAVEDIENKNHVTATSFMPGQMQ